MKYTTLLAIKNIIRYKKRTILTSLVLAVGTASFIFYTGLIDGFNDASLSNMIDLNSGHIKIVSQNYNRDEPYSLTNTMTQQEVKTVMLKIKNFKFIKGYTRRLFFLAEVDNMQDKLPIIVTAIDPLQDHTVFRLHKFVSQGDFRSKGIILGEKLAKGFNKHLKGNIYLSFRRKLGMVESLGLTISGLLKTTNPTINNSAAFIPLQKAQTITGVNGVTEISLKTTNIEEVSKYQKILRQNFPNLKIITWKELNSSLENLIKMKNSFIYVFIFFLTIIAIIGIINTMTLSVFQRQKEIGTLKAIGFEDKQIMRIFLTEGTLIGIIGSMLGMIIGVLINWYFVEIGIDFSKIYENMDIGLPVMGVIKSTWNLSRIVLPVAVSIIAGFGASFLPAAKTIKMDPVKALRTVQ